MGMPEPHQAANLAALSGLAHGFFTRHGGVSRGIYESLNCGPGSRDEPDAVRENRARVAARLGARGIVSVHQVHGTDTVVASEIWPDTGRPRADAIITATPGIAVGVLTADCAPILFADADAGVAAAAHAGWRGAIAGVAEAAVEAMEQLGARRGRTHAAIGPTIGPEAYEVGWDLERDFLERDSESALFFSRPSAEARPHLDLAGYLAHRLARTGLASVTGLGLCTFAQNKDFFSYRRSKARKEPDYGRQISAIVLT
jgi:YfiH family protein